MTDSQNKTARKAAGDEAGTSEYVTAMVGNQLCGCPVLMVQDVLGPQTIARVPLAPPEVAGSLNLRGRIVTALDMRVCLNLPPRPAELREMSIVVDHDGELYALAVDSVGEVVAVRDADFQRPPPTLEEGWREVATGVFRMEDRLLLVLDVARLLGRITQRAA